MWVRMRSSNTAVVKTLEVQVVFATTTASCMDGIRQRTVDGCLNAGGTVQNEACDDGDGNGATDGCGAACTIVSGFSCEEDSVTYKSTCYKCGDGKWSPTEACDDGNTNDTDGCSNTCTINTGWTCHSGYGLTA